MLNNYKALCCAAVTGFMVAMAVATFPSLAAADDADACMNGRGNTQMTACDRAIQSGKYTGTELASLYSWRGFSYSLKADKDRAIADRAIADYSEAIRLDPSNEYFYRRATVYVTKKDHDRAIADLSAAIRIDPKDVRYFYIRGHSYRDKGDTNRANSDYAEAKRLDPEYVADQEEFKKKLELLGKTLNR